MTETVTISRAEYDALTERLEDLDDIVAALKAGGGQPMPLEWARRIMGFRQVSRRLAVGWVTAVEEPLQSGEVRDAVSALLFGQNDRAFGPNDARLSTLSLPRLWTGLQ